MLMKAVLFFLLLLLPVFSEAFLGKWVERAKDSAAVWCVMLPTAPGTPFVFRIMPGEYASKEDGCGPHKRLGGMAG